MKRFVTEKSGDLVARERNLLSVAYKNVVGARRTSWRVITSTMEKEKSKDDNNSELYSKYQKEVEKELEDICNEVIVSSGLVIPYIRLYR